MATKAGRREVLRGLGPPHHAQRREQPARPGDGFDRARRRGVSAVTPVVFELENSVLGGSVQPGAGRTSRRSIPRASRRWRRLRRVVPRRSARAAVAALDADPKGALVDVETADDLQVETGDTVEVILALGTDRETRASLRVVGLFERFPGFPEGANLVVEPRPFQEGHRRRNASTSSSPRRPTTVRRPGASGHGARSGPGRARPIHVDSTETALDKDQSSLTALNVNGLVSLDWLYVAAHERGDDRDLRVRPDAAASQGVRHAAGRWACGSGSCERSCWSRQIIRRLSRPTEVLRRSNGWAPGARDPEPQPFVYGIRLRVETLSPETAPGPPAWRTHERSRRRPYHPSPQTCCLLPSGRCPWSPPSRARCTDRP